MGHHEHPRKGRARLSLPCHPARELPGPPGRPSAVEAAWSPMVAGNRVAHAGLAGPTRRKLWILFLFFSVRSIKLGKSARADLDEPTRPEKAGTARGARLGITGLGAAGKLSGRTPSTSLFSGLKPAHVGSSSLSLLSFTFPFPFYLSVFSFHSPFSHFIFHFPLRFQFSISIYSFPFLPSFFSFLPPQLLLRALQHRMSPQGCPCHLPSPCQGDLPIPEGQGKVVMVDTPEETRAQIFGINTGTDIWGRQGLPGPWEGHGGTTGQAARGSGLLGTPGTDTSRDGWHSQMCAQGVARGQPDVRGRRWALSTCSAAGRALGTGCGREGVTLGTGRVTPVAGVTPGRRCHPGAGGRSPRRGSG